MCLAQKTPQSRTFKFVFLKPATKATKRICRCKLHEISYEACLSWALFSFVNNEIFSNYFTQALISISRKPILLINFPKITADIFWVLKTTFLSIPKQQISNFSNNESSRWQFSHKIGEDLKHFKQIIYQKDLLSSSDSIKWCAPTKELTFPMQLRTFVTLGSELGGKAPRPIL